MTIYSDYKTIVLALCQIILAGIITGCGGDGGGDGDVATGTPANKSGLQEPPVYVTTPPSVEVVCNGVDIYPSYDAVSIIYSNPEGSTFCFKAGAHYLSAPINARANDKYIGEVGAILDGADTITHAIYGSGSDLGAKNVIVRGLVIQKFHNDFSDFKTRYAIKPGDGWIIENNEIRYNYEIGIFAGKDITLRNNNIHHNGRYGMWVGPGQNQNLLVDGNEIAFNNTRDLQWSSAGAIKAIGSTVGTSGITWVNNWVHHNNGHGLHNDANVGPGVEIAFNRIEDNEGVGIFSEASWGAEIHDNIVVNNAKAYINKSCFWGSQIHNQNSSGWHVYNNYVESTEGANGICFVDTDAGDADPFSVTVTDNIVSGNTIKVVGAATNGLVHNGEFAPYDTSDVYFTQNTYFVPDPDIGISWVFRIPLTMAEWNALGQDLDSVFNAW